MTTLAWYSRPWVVFSLSLMVLLPTHLTAAICSDWFGQPPKPIGDGVEYENIAYHLAQGMGYRVDNTDPGWRSIYEQRADSYGAHLQAPPRNMFATGRPPLLPSVIAGVYALFGRNSTSFAIVRCLSACYIALAGALSALLVASYFSRTAGTAANGLTHRRASIGAGAAAIAVTILAMSNRTLQSYADDFLTEPGALLLVQVFMVVAILGTRQATAKSPLVWSSLMGLVFGLLILARSVFVVWLPAVWLLAFVSSPGVAAQRLRQSSLTIAVALLVCLPWWTRNVSILKRWMPLGTQGSIALLGGYSDEALAERGEWQYQPELTLRAQLANDPVYLAASNDTEREIMVCQQARQLVNRWIAEHLSDLPGMFIGRIFIHWNPYFGRSLAWKIAALAGAAILVLDRWRRGSEAGSYAIWLIGFPLTSTLVAALLYTTGGRFLVPMYGVLYTLSGIAVGTSVQGLLGWFTQTQDGR